MMDGSLYPPPRATQPEAGLSARTCDPEPSVPAAPAGATPTPFVVASAETLSYAVATGEIGDPRAFKRPVRVTVPRALPTDDVLVLRERRAADVAKKTAAPAPPAAPPAPVQWKAAQTLDVVDAFAFLAERALANSGANGKAHPPVAIACATLDEVRSVVARVADGGHVEHVRAVLAPFIPSGVVALLSGLGVAAIEVDAAAVKGLRESKDVKPARSIALPAPAQWSEREAPTVALGGAKTPLTWLALGVERTWASAGTARPAAAPAKR
jgi:aconitate hydratase